MKTFAIGSPCSPEVADFYDRGVPYQVTGLLRSSAIRSVFPLPPARLSRIAVNDDALIQTFVSRQSVQNYVN